MDDYELRHAEGWQTGRGSGRESTPQTFSITEKPAPEDLASAVKGQNTAIVILEAGPLIDVGISPEYSLYPKENPAVEPKMASATLDDDPGVALQNNGNSMKIVEGQNTAVVIEDGPLIDVGISPENFLYPKENPAVESKMANATLDRDPKPILQPNGNSIKISTIESKAANETREYDPFRPFEYIKTSTATKATSIAHTQEAGRPWTPVNNKRAQWKATVRDKIRPIQEMSTLPVTQKAKMNGLGHLVTPFAAASSSGSAFKSAPALLASPTPHPFSPSVPPHLVGISRNASAKHISEVTNQLSGPVPTTNTANFSTKTTSGQTSIRPQTKRRHLVTFARKKDNPARGDFRAGRRCNATFALTKSCIDIEPDGMRMSKVLEEIGVRFGSFIRPPQSSTDRTLLIWGKPPQITQTVRELNQWVAASAAPFHSSLLARISHVTKGGNEFAKVSLTTEEVTKILDRQLQEQAMKHKYQKIPDKSLNCKYLGYYLWPVNEIRPEDLLGPSFEAFDPLRMSFNSYILFDAKLEAFKVMADQAERVEKAMLRIEGAFKEFVARSNPATTMYMVERLDELSVRKDVKMVKKSLSPSEHAQVPSLTGDMLESSELVKWSEDTKPVEEEQLFSFHEKIEKGLKRLRFFRSRVRMRVLLGTFALTTYRRWPEGVTSIPFERFIEDINLSATKGRMLQE